MFVKNLTLLIPLSINLSRALKTNCPDIEVGYIEKRSNAKRWIEDTQDLEAMYNTFATSDEITLWCNGQQKMSEEKNLARGKMMKLKLL